MQFGTRKSSYEMQIIKRWIKYEKRKWSEWWTRKYADNIQAKFKHWNFNDVQMILTNLSPSHCINNHIGSERLVHSHSILFW